MSVEVQYRVGLAQLQRVADALQVAAVEPHPPERLQHTHRVIVHDGAQRVGVQIDRVALRELPRHGVARHIAVVRRLVVVAIVACQDHLVHIVGDDDVAPRLAIVARPVVVHRVAHQRLAVAGVDLCPVIQRGVVLAGVVPPVAGVDGVAVVHNHRLVDDGGYVRLRVVAQQLRVHLILVVDQVHIGRELGLLGVHLIAPILRRQFGVVLVVDNRPVVEVVAHIALDLIVQAVGHQRGRPVLQAHVVTQLRHLVFAIVVQHVAVGLQRVGLRHVHVPEGVERTRLVVEVGTVAIHVHVAAPEAHIAPQHLILRAAVLVGHQLVGILQKHLARLVTVGLGYLRSDAAHVLGLGTCGGTGRLRVFRPRGPPHRCHQHCQYHHRQSSQTSMPQSMSHLFILLPHQPPGSRDAPWHVRHLAFGRFWQAPLGAASS